MRPTAALVLLVALTVPLAAKDPDPRTTQAFQWGLPTDIPVAGDFDGDGRPDLVIYRPAIGTWYLRLSSAGYALAQAVKIQWGLPGDVPMPGDYDADGKTDVAVWRPSTGTWYIVYSSGRRQDQ